MIHVDRILFPTDGSDCAAQARRHAAHLAVQFEAELHVIHVDDREVEPSDVVEIEKANVLTEFHDVDRGDETLVPKPHLLERKVGFPSAAGGILSYAAEHDVQLIVLGTHGRRGIRRLVLGSVAEEVVRRAPQPVVTVGRGAIGPDGIAGGRMIVPVDLSKHRDRLLPHAREIALVYGMDVMLLHVLPSGTMSEMYDIQMPGTPSDSADQEARNALKDDAASFQQSGIGVSVNVETGHPAHRTLEVAEDIGAAFITIATHGRTGGQRILLGSVSQKVIRQAPCPVCTVKSFGMSLV